MIENKQKPTLLDALFPIAILVCLLVLAVYFFGDDSSSGPTK